MMIPVPFPFEIEPFLIMMITMITDYKHICHTFDNLVILYNYQIHKHTYPTVSLLQEGIIKEYVGP